MGAKSGPRHEANVKSLDSLEPSDWIFYLSRNNGNAYCSVDDPYHNWFVYVPKDAFDAVSRNGVASVGEIKKYLTRTQP